MAEANSTKLPNFKHGLYKTSEYLAHSSMKNRCLNPNNCNYGHYGGRGIKVCARWIQGFGGLSGFECFLQDMGKKPSPQHSLDRINNDGNYEPNNCRWAVKRRQAQNRRSVHLLTINGATHCLEEWSEISGIKAATIFSRLKNNWSAEEAVFSSKKSAKERKTNLLITAYGKTQNVREWAEELGITSGSIRARIRKGMSAEDAISFKDK